MDGPRTPMVVAVWITDGREPDSVSTFTPDQYADWYEINQLTGDYPLPTTFYGATGTGHLDELAYCVTASPYDEHDYAHVTHTWSYKAINGVYATGVARRDGRA